MINIIMKETENQIFIIQKSYKIDFNFARKNVSFLQNWNTYILEINVGSNSGKSDRKSTEYFKPWRYILGKFSIEKNWSVQFHNRSFCKKRVHKRFFLQLEFTSRPSFGICTTFLAHDSLHHNHHENIWCAS